VSSLLCDAITFIRRRKMENKKIIEQDLAKSGLELSEIKQYGVGVFTDSEEILKKRLGYTSYNGHSLLKDCQLLEFSYFDKEGNNIFSRFRLYPNLDGVKYLHPLNTPARPYILPEVWSEADKSHKPLWITEGEKKALKLFKMGRSAIALSGVWNFKAGKDNKDSFSKEIWEELLGFNLGGRIIFLAFDMDLWVNPQVRKALYELALKLYKKGAIVRFVHWDISKGKGVDDVLGNVTNAEEELLKLEHNAERLEDFVEKDHYEEVVRAIKIAGLPADKEEMIVKPLSKKFGIKINTFIKRIKPDQARISEREPEKYTEEELQQAEALLKNPNFWDEYIKTCHKSYVDRDAELILVKLASVTRHFDRGVSVILTGSSSIGKSSLLETVRATIDCTQVEDLSSISEQYLVYSDIPMEHRIFLFYETRSAHEALNIVKLALTEGRIVRGTVVKNNKGGLEARKIDKPADGLVIFSTFASGGVDFELKNRVIMVEMTSTPELRQAINLSYCQQEYECINPKIFRIADSLIEPCEVVIPYEESLAKAFPYEEERFNRDHKKVRTLIKANALLHQRQRDKDKSGRIIATREDYEVIYKIGHLIAQSMSTLTEGQLKFLQTIKSMVPDRLQFPVDPGDGRERGYLNKVTIIDKLKGEYTESTINVYLSKLKKLGYITFQGRGSSTAISEVIVPERHEWSVLPTIEEVFEGKVRTPAKAEKS